MEFFQKCLHAGTFFVPVILMFCGFSTPVYAELGAGWIQTSFTKKIHLDDEEGLQTFTWSPYRSVGIETPCADYSYDSATDTETFQIFDGRSNRSEIRIQNDYDGGIFQFEGYVTFYTPLNDESLFQIFGYSTPDRATLTMMRGYSSSGGSIRPTSVGGTTIAANCYDVERRINIIHDQNNYVRYYVDGILKAQFNESDIATNYWKYGCYGTVYSDTVPVRVKWRAVRTFRDGVPPEMPVITTQPLNQVRGPANDKPDAVFVVAATNATAYQWYKNGVIFSGGNGAATATLTITNVQQSDEGQYYCKVSNTGNVYTNSDTVWLEYARQTSQWDFEENYVDSIGGYNIIAATGPNAPTFGQGTVGDRAVLFDGIDDYGTIPVGAMPNAGTEISIAMWAKGNAVSHSMTPIYADATSMGSNVNRRIVNIHLPYSNNSIYFDTGNSVAASGFYDRVSIVKPAQVPAVQWTHYVFAKDTETGIQRIYMNGQRLDISMATNLTARIFGAENIYFGFSNGIAATGDYFDGLIDSMRIYNYALDAVEIAWLYYDQSGQSVCVDRENPILQAYDFNNNCIVDLGDLAIMASYWLYTQKVPGIPR